MHKQEVEMFLSDLVNPGSDSKNCCDIYTFLFVDHLCVAFLLEL